MTLFEWIVIVGAAVLAVVLTIFAPVNPKGTGPK